MDYITDCTKVHYYVCGSLISERTMSRDADKHIRVREETWLELNKKKRPGDSFDDVLQRLLDEDREETIESDL